ncbi:sugar nucleotide-binding protein [Lysinibacillus louembei]|uniref:dTDP-4-dehydrorhamnose reductase n=1 Tax=Lysinibacillus louembei TaxID=1470088 RepID=A0ABZ0RV68_9BACI|nr:sugar nucleotide-binding protein [Lysinibacillus louembei]WPK11167.1 sugar nucleotide-binding protein [Lysinibacillus louembei]
MKKLLILGASGLVGRALVEQCRHDFDVYGTYFSSSVNLPEHKQFYLDLEPETLLHILQSVQPDIVVSGLQGDYRKQLALHKALAEFLQHSATPLYFISTTNVFDGDLTRHHIESDTPISKSDYGKFKIAREKMLQESLQERCCIVRIPGIWGKDCPRLRKLQGDIAANKPIKPYSNLQWSFLLDTQLAKQLHYIMENDLTGIIHLGATDMLTDSAFYEQLLPEQATLEPVPYENAESTYYFGLKTEQPNRLPSDLYITNAQIVAALTA